VKLLRALRATSWLTNFLYRKAPGLYVPVYDTFKRLTERHEIALIGDLVGPGDCVLDVGAYIGFYSELFARRVGPSGRVYAFEPSPLSFQRLVARARPYTQIEPVHAAVTDRDGTTTLHLSPRLSMDHRTYASRQARATVEVRAVTIDGFFGGAPPGRAGGRAGGPAGHA
jgi:FkbM family methyltransferase